MRSTRVSRALNTFAFVGALTAATVISGWVLAQSNGDRGNLHTYRNPILHSEYSDPDVIRVGNVFVLVASSFNEVPGLPILQSFDLVSWKIVGHALARHVDSTFNIPQYGKGVWAPSIRHWKGMFRVYFGDPDRGIYVVSSENAEGPWGSPTMVIAGKGLIDPCPFWDDDGKAYLVHAWAKSRAGFNSILTVRRMNAEGTVAGDSGVTVFDGHANHPTIEGPKLYKRNGLYYILAPAGGVKTGWQVALRGPTPFGPFEDRVVLEQGKSVINGPHQGAWVEHPDGRSWFVHFQDKGAYGRIVHLQPLVWKNNWPVVGSDPDGDGKGEPVLEFSHPAGSKVVHQTLPQSSDDFSDRSLGLQWQWNANPRNESSSLSARPGWLRLRSTALPVGEVNLRGAPNVLVQRFPARAFSATALVSGARLNEGGRGGLTVFGKSYGLIGLERRSNGIFVIQARCDSADVRHPEVVEAEAPAPDPVWLRFTVDSGAQCRFSWSSDGREFTIIGNVFAVREGNWIGPRIGLFSTSKNRTGIPGYLDIDEIVVL